MNYPNPDKTSGKFRVINDVVDYLDFFDLDKDFFNQTCQGSDEPFIRASESELIFINFLDYEGELRLLSIDLEALQNGQVATAQSINSESYSAFCDIQMTEVDGNLVIGLACQVYSEDELLESCGIIAGQEGSLDAENSVEEDAFDQDVDLPDPDGSGEEELVAGPEAGEIVEEESQDENSNLLPSIEQLNDNYSAFEVKAFDILRNGLATCVAVGNSNFHEGQSLNLQRCNQSEAQKFFYQKGSGQIKVQNLDNLCWGLPDVTFESGSTLSIFRCVDRFEAQAFDYDLSTYQIKLRSSNNLCLAVSGGRNEDGTAIELQVCEDDSSQRFFMGRAVHIRSLFWENSCLKVHHVILEENDLIQNARCLPHDRSQVFLYEPWSGSLRLKANSNLCLNIREGNFQDGTPLNLFDCNETMAQRLFYLEEDQQIQSLADSNYCLSSSGDFTKLASCQDHLSQKYEFIDIFTVNELSLFEEGEIPPSNQFELSSHPLQVRMGTFFQGERLCVDVENGNLFAGAFLNSWTCNGGGGQKYLYREEEGMIYSYPGIRYCWDVPQGNFVDGQRLQVFPCNGSPAQQLTYDKISHQIKLRARPDLNLCVEPEFGNGGLGTPLVLAGCHQGQSQKFLLSQDIQIQSLMIGHEGQDLCFDVDSAIFQEDNPLNVYRCKEDYEIAQRFAYESWSGLIRGVQDLDYCVNDTGQNLTVEAGMQINTCRDLPAQKFYYHSRTKSLVSVENPNLCIGLMPADNRDGSPLHIRTCNGEIEQRFDLVDSRPF